MHEIEITPVFPQVNTDPKGTDIPWEAIETATDVQTVVDDESARQTVHISPRPEIERQAPEPRIFSWSDYGMNKWMKARTRIRNSVRKARTLRSAGRTHGEARSSTC
jgi:hypothetical protein